MSERDDVIRQYRQMMLSGDATTGIDWDAYDAAWALAARDPAALAELERIHRELIERHEGAGGN